MDALNLAGRYPSAGQIADSRMPTALTKDQPVESVVADKGYDRMPRHRDYKPRQSGGHPATPNRLNPRTFDRHIYKSRN
ncbi:MAG: hypothetical protein HS120_05695 [Burkholderiales bacterium]|nr:hypothetical protein [Burkholderiales bacterium]